MLGEKTSTDSDNESTTTLLLWMDKKFKTPIRLRNPISAQISNNIMSI